MKETTIEDQAKSFVYDIFYLLECEFEEKNIEKYSDKLVAIIKDIVKKQ